MSIVSSPEAVEVLDPFDVGADIEFNDCDLEFQRFRCFINDVVNNMKPYDDERVAGLTKLFEQCVERNRYDRVEYSVITDVGFFKFFIVKTSAKGHYEIQIKQSPDYGGRDSDSNIVGRGNSIVDGETDIILLSCPKNVDSVEKAKGIAGLWVKLTCRYIETGELLNF
ncbi:MAG: hypothetical protein ABII07_00150 [Patescibacteria group bacterium]|nr:hypothetical protein [Patescibacteria group bacterium]